MKAADLSQPVARKREGQVRWCKSAAMIFNGDILPNKTGAGGSLAAAFADHARPLPGIS